MTLDDQFSYNILTSYIHHIAAIKILETLIPGPEFFQGKNGVQRSPDRLTAGPRSQSSAMYMMVWSMTVIWCYIQIIQIWPSQWRKSGMNHDFNLNQAWFYPCFYPCLMEIDFRNLRVSSTHLSHQQLQLTSRSSLISTSGTSTMTSSYTTWGTSTVFSTCCDVVSTTHPTTEKILGIWFPLTWRSNRNEALQIHRSIMIHRSRVNQPFVWVWLCDFIFLANLCRWKSWCANITKPRCVLDDLLGDLLFHIFHLQNPWPKWQGNGRWQRRVVDMSSLSRHLHFGNLSYHFADFHFGHLPHTRKTRSGCWKNVLANRIKLGWPWWYGIDFSFVLFSMLQTGIFPTCTVPAKWQLPSHLVPDVTSSARTRRGGSCLKDIYKTFLIYRTCMRRAPAKPVRALCESGVLFHMSHLKLHFTLHTRQSSHSRLHTSHCTLRSPHFTVHTSHFTLHTSHFTLHTSHFTLHTSYFTLHTSHCTLLAPHFTLHPSSHLSSAHLIAKVEKNLLTNHYRNLDAATPILFTFHHGCRTCQWAGRTAVPRNCAPRARKSGPHCRGTCSRANYIPLENPIKKWVNAWYIHQHLPVTVFESHAVASFLCCWCITIITCLLASLTWKIAEQLKPDATASNRVLSAYLFFTTSMQPLFQDIFYNACCTKISRSNPRITC